MTDDFIRAPWTAAEVDALNRFQRRGEVHPFTCPNHGDADGDRTLFATHQGWICAHCDYRQDWAHRAMLDVPLWAEVRHPLPCDVMLPPATLVRKGVELGELMTELQARAALPAEQCRFNDPTARALPALPAGDIGVTVEGGDYRYEGRLAGLAMKASGAVRYVIEDGNGRLFIHNARQIGREEGWTP